MPPRGKGGISQTNLPITEDKRNLKRGAEKEDPAAAPSKKKLAPRKKKQEAEVDTPVPRAQGRPKKVPVSPTAKEEDTKAKTSKNARTPAVLSDDTNRRVTRSMTQKAAPPKTPEKPKQPLATLEKPRKTTAVSKTPVKPTQTPVTEAKPKRPAPVPKASQEKKSFFKAGQGPKNTKPKTQPTASKVSKTPKPVRPPPKTTRFPPPPGHITSETWKSLYDIPDSQYDEAFQDTPAPWAPASRVSKERQMASRNRGCAAYPGAPPQARPFSVTPEPWDGVDYLEPFVDAATWRGYYYDLLQELDSYAAQKDKIIKDLTQQVDSPKAQEKMKPALTSDQTEDLRLKTQVRLEGTHFYDFGKGYISSPELDRIEAEIHNVETELKRAAKKVDEKTLEEAYEDVEDYRYLSTTVEKDGTDKHAGLEAEIARLANRISKSNPTFDDEGSRILSLGLERFLELRGALPRLSMELQVKVKNLLGPMGAQKFEDFQKLIADLEAETKNTPKARAAESAIIKQVAELASPTGAFMWNWDDDFGPFKEWRSQPVPKSLEWGKKLAAEAQKLVKKYLRHARPGQRFDAGTRFTPAKMAETEREAQPGWKDEIRKLELQRLAASGDYIPFEQSPVMQHLNKSNRKRGADEKQDEAAAKKARSVRSRKK
ncbi:hypothetical protein B0H63DRAFT_187775 [Podospora didyma]|uniref:Uncharacterized protein n=1 Tax=Podospora didyma TaxID=330526 RepID=A0AAE0TZZ6_9PEZI|nr:hypothetical protein B0H63DRAFT_187775 [Podospora didyma]